MTISAIRSTRYESAGGWPLRITPFGLLGGPLARRLLARNFLVLKRDWVPFVSGFFEPFFYLLSIGIGLSHLVGGLSVDGKVVSYTSFVAPGLLATSAMNGSLYDAIFNIWFKLRISHTYDAILSTPLSPGDVAAGELTWSLFRGSCYTASFLVVMAAMGYAATPWTALCFPAAVLVSFGFAGVGMMITTFLRGWQDFDMVSLFLFPLFLFSGTFYPLSVYPGWLQGVVRITPLYQGVALVRGFDLGQFDWVMLPHALYLLAMGIVGLWVTRRRIAKILQP
jgi:lipooligosaccharide transport system permease protein